MLIQSLDSNNGTVVTGNNFWHFRHVHDGDGKLCASCVTMGLLRLPLYSVSGLPDLKSGINGTPPIYVFPVGQNLKETLERNWLCSADEPGEPIWVSETPCRSNTVPLLYGLTAPARRVFLMPPEEKNCRCDSCGEYVNQYFSTCQFVSAGTLENANWTDPHVVYTTTAKGERATQRASDLTKSGGFAMDRPWPYLVSNLLRKDSISDGKMAIVGFATDKAKNIDVWQGICKYLFPIH